jgi:hypothetical protein
MSIETFAVDDDNSMTQRMNDIASHMRVAMSMATLADDDDDDMTW